MKLLKFEASWCAPCKQLSEVMKNVEIPFPVSVIDIDENREAAMSYGIRSVPTLILVDENENQIKRVSGSMNQSQLTEFIGI